MLNEFQDRISKVVAFILSLHSDTYRPFLIVSTAASLHSWEDEFYQLDPSTDVVIYNGNKEMRNIIRRLEFYDEEHCILFQVLIVAPEVLVEVCSRSCLPVNGVYQCYLWFGIGPQEVDSWISSLIG